MQQHRRAQEAADRIREETSGRVELRIFPNSQLGSDTDSLSQLRSGGIDPSRFRVGAYGSDAAHRPALPPIAARRAERYFGRVPSGPEVVIIGDTPADIHCGSGISARAVAVATGGYSVSELAACGPHAVFEDLSDTERVLQAILR